MDTPSDMELIPGELPEAALPAGEKSVTEHDAVTYLPNRVRTHEIALCLSGGGFRAALLHLGAMRRLNELGVLSKIETISSVSGGSIAAAYFAAHLDPWPSPGTIIETDKWNNLTQRFLEFTQKNRRTGPLLKRLWPPWNLIGKPSVSVEGLMETYKRHINGKTLRDLPDRPRFIFCAAELSYGVNWIFSKEAVGDYQVGYMRPAPDWPIARAVAASSCFPPAFDPMPVPDDFKSAKLVDSNARKNGDPNYKKNLSSLMLNDAGVYDNLGLEPVWKSHKIVLVSDGGATFDPDWDKGIVWRLSRPMRIMGNQSTALRKRWLMSNFIAHDLCPTNPYTLQGTYWGIGTPTARYGLKGQTPPAGYSPGSVSNFIAQIRTDMDTFSDAEAQILENHGYLLADAAIRRYTPQLIEPHARPLAVPYRAWFEGPDLDDRIKSALGSSGKVKVLGR
ncbi:MAG TPA: patatin-like phospholipase family protein [Chloroflexia bacterium]